MSFKAYEEYKDSGVEWLGEIPTHWVVSRLKNKLELITDRATKRTNPIALENIEGWSGKFLANETDYSGEGIAFQENDILFGKLRPYLAKVFLPKYSGEAIGDFHVLRKKNNVDTKYIAHQFLMPEFISVIDGATHGAKMPRVGWEVMGNMPLVVPSEKEQTTIAAFLDHETARIDALIEEQQRLIALLKEKRQAVISHAVTKGLDPNVPMKDSGVEWLGDVPAHWEIIKISRLYTSTSEPGDTDLPILQVSIHHGVSNKELSEEESDRKITRILDKEKYRKVKPGDLVYNMMRAWQGGFGAVTVNGLVSPAYVVCRPKIEQLTPYIEKLLRTPNAIEQMRTRSYGITDFRLRLYWDEFKTIEIALPPIEERMKIVGMLEELVLSTSRLEKSAAELIKLFQERRSALISAAVTGKIDVRDWQPPKDNQTAAEPAEASA